MVKLTKLNISKLNSIVLFVLLFCSSCVSSEEFLAVNGKDTSKPQHTLMTNESREVEEYGSGLLPGEIEEPQESSKNLIVTNTDDLLLTQSTTSKILSSTSTSNYETNSTRQKVHSSSFTAPVKPIDIQTTTEPSRENVSTTRNITTTPSSTSFAFNDLSTILASTTESASVTKPTEASTTTQAVTSSVPHIIMPLDNTTNVVISRNSSLNEEVTRPSLDIQMNETTNSEVDNRLFKLNNFNLIHGAVLITILAVVAMILVGFSIYSCQKHKLSGTSSDGTRSSTKSSPATKTKGSSSEDSLKLGSKRNTKNLNKFPIGDLDVSQPLKPQENEEPVLDSYFA